MSDASANPFTMIAKALWQLAETWPEIDALIAPENRISYTRDTIRDTEKRKVQAGDLPALVLSIEGAAFNLHSTSSTTRCVRTYAWLISTGDKRYNKFLSHVEWMLYATMHDFSSVLGGMTWPSDDWHFVKRWDLTSGVSGQSDAEKNRGIKGWSAVMNVEVECYFRRADIAALVAAESSLSSISNGSKSIGASSGTS